MSLYTKTGDKGETSLRGGIRVHKTHYKIKLLGQLDELNSVIGLCRFNQTHLRLRDVQMVLMEMCAQIAESEQVSLHVHNEKWEMQTQILEAWIDREDSELPPLKNFLIPGGTDGAVRLMYARAVCRRVEVVFLETFGEDYAMYKYLNRLSDFLFALSRKANYINGIDDDLWIRR